MELPDLGKHCSESTCKQLDFLPMKCDACKKIFCGDHYTYGQHHCGESYKKDNQVPVCPLCNRPIPLLPGQTADSEVSKHIDSDCQSDPAKQRRGKVYKNKCAKQGCKNKEIVPVICDTCQKNFCLRHRMEADHDCKGFQDSGRGMSKQGAAAVFRNAGPSQSSSKQATSGGKPQQTTLTQMGFTLDQERRQRQAAAGGNRVTATAVHNMQGAMSEDEAMARALAASMSDSSSSKPTTTSSQQNDEATVRRMQEEEDAALARALAQSEQEARGANNRTFPVFG